MKKIEIQKSPIHNEADQHVADMHSFINLLNVLAGVLIILDGEVSQKNKELMDLVDEVVELANTIRKKDKVPYALESIKAMVPVVLDLVENLRQESEDDAERAAADYACTNLRSIFDITGERIEELETRAENPDIWVDMDVRELEQKFIRFFKSVEKNSNNCYKIQFNLADKEESDYYLDLRIQSDREDGRLYIPLRLIDILRDLSANARKFTNPGGRIVLDVYQNDEAIKCRIEDDGLGIPDQEMHKVVEFGYRASNVLDRETKGGGFGLTKAAWLILSWGGRLIISSEEDKGSLFSIWIPVKSAAQE